MVTAGKRKRNKPNSNEVTIGWLRRHLSLKMINDPVNNLQINLFEGSDSLVNFALPIKFDEHLSLPRSGRLIRKKLDYQWNITNRSVFQPSEHIPQNGPVDLSEEDVPILAVQLEVFFGAVTASDLLGESVGEFKISRGKMTVRRFCRQINEGQPEFRNVQGLLWGERFYDSSFVRLHGDSALVLKRLQRFADRRPADFESCRQVHLREPLSRFEDVIQNRIPDLSDDYRRSLLDLGDLVVHVLNRQLAHRKSFN